jgi:hypothetical protein
VIDEVALALAVVDDALADTDPADHDEIFVEGGSFDREEDSAWTTT